jgi:hypothetical protein
MEIFVEETSLKINYNLDFSNVLNMEQGFLAMMVERTKNITKNQFFQFVIKYGKNYYKIHSYFLSKLRFHIQRINFR